MTCKSKNIRKGDRFLYRGMVLVADSPCLCERGDLPCGAWRMYENGTYMGTQHAKNMVCM